MNTSRQWIIVAERAAKKAEKIMLAHLRAGSIKVYKKEGGEAYTNCDVLCEKAIIQTIRDDFPSHSFLAEESGRSGGNSEFLWIIDPIDGTNNFIAGIPFFAVSIALALKNELAAGVISNPISGENFSAQKGGGIILNGKKAQIGKTEKLEKSIVGVGVGGHNRAKRETGVCAAFQKNSKRIRVLGASALEIAYVASGKLDGYIGLHGHLWDYAAAVLMMREAGGNVLNHLGEEWGFKDETIIAANPRLAGAMVKNLCKAVL